jgi:hypothetical protein
MSYRLREQTAALLLPSFLFMSPVHIGLLVLWSKKFLKNKKLAASVEFKQTMYGHK